MPWLCAYVDKPYVHQYTIFTTAENHSSGAQNYLNKRIDNF